MGSVSREARRCLPVAPPDQNLLPAGRRRFEGDTPQSAAAPQRTMASVREISR